MHPELTVGILTYNSERTVGDTLSSLRAQTLEPSRWQVLIVDHGSSDGTRRLCENFVQDFGRARIIVRQENHIANSRQHILEQTASEWVVFCDSDVILPPDWLTLALSFAAKKRAQSQFSGVGAPLLLRPQSSQLASLARMQQHFLGHFATEQMWLSRPTRKASHLPTAAALFRRQHLLEAGGFHPRWRHCGEDLELGARLTAAGKELWVTPELCAIHQLSCRTWGDWSRRAFRFGRARIQVACVQPQLWFTRRTCWPLLFTLPPVIFAFLFLATGALFWLECLGIFFGLYFLVLWLSLRALGAAGLTFATHISFAWGELCELVSRSAGARL